MLKIGSPRKSVKHACIIIIPIEITVEHLFYTCIWKEVYLDKLIH